MPDSDDDDERDRGFHNESTEITNHRNSIERIFVSQYMDDTKTYVITHSKQDHSIAGWSIDFESYGQQQPGKFYKIKEDDLGTIAYDIKSSALYKEKLALCYSVTESEKDCYKQCLIDLNKSKCYNLEHSSIDDRGQYTLGFLPDSDSKNQDARLILVSLNDHKIYKYRLNMTENKTSNTTENKTLKFSKIYDIKIPKRLDDQSKCKLCCSIYQQMLFLCVQNRKTSILQFDLSTMDLVRQYDLLLDWNSQHHSDKFTTVINKDQTLLAIEISCSAYIFSMKNGRLISKFSLNGQYSDRSTPVEFVTSKNGFESLIIDSKSYGMTNNSYVLINPYQPFENYQNLGDNLSGKTIITKLNKRIFIKKNSVYVKEALDDDKLKQVSNSTNSIYDSSIFDDIRIMFKDIQKKSDQDIKRTAQYNIPFQDGNVILEENGSYDNLRFENKMSNQIVPLRIPCTFSWKIIHKKYLVLITVEKIAIYTKYEDSSNGITGITCRYQWYNEKWKKAGETFRDNYSNKKNTCNFIPYKKIFKDILKEEFKGLTSLPLPEFSSNFNDPTNNLMVEEIINDKDKLIEMLDRRGTEIIAKFIINDADLFSKYGPEILKEAIKNQYDDVVKNVIDKIIKSIQINSNNYNYHQLSDPSKTNYSYMTTLLPFISLNFLDLCNNYPDFVIKYISYTSIILSPYCDSIKSSTNTSLYSYSKNFYIEKSKENNYINKLISSLFKRLTMTNSNTNRQSSIMKQKEVQTISFIVPFPQICVYKKNNDSNQKNKNKNQETENNQEMNHETGSNHNDNIWNEFLHKQKSILFCNIDSNHFYNWWNFAAIIDFKWKTFGWIYHYLIWFFYSVFCICYTLASMLEPNSITDIQRKSLFIISIIFGSIFLIFEIRQCLWNHTNYFNDLWNLFDIGSYSLPIAASICWIINKSQPHWLVAISTILLSFKFLLFFRVFKSFGIYFAIILGVAKTVYPFLVVLFFILLGYAQAFYFILRTVNVNDNNDPWNLATRFYFANSDEIINDTTTLVQPPDSNTNLFNWFPTSLFAVYKIITGDSGSLSPWTYRENPLMTILLVTFTFFTVIYLLNLFIGLLNIAIADYNKEEEFLLQKAQIIMEIELFYMFSHWRYDKEWFPDWIYYDMPVTEVRKLINAIDNDKTMFNYYLPVISTDLRNLVALIDDIKEEQKNKEFSELKYQQISQRIQYLQMSIQNLQMSVQNQQMGEKNQQMGEKNQQMNAQNQQMGLLISYQLNVLQYQQQYQQMSIQNQNQQIDLQLSILGQQISVLNQQMGVANQENQQQTPDQQSQQTGGQNQRTGEQKQNQRTGEQKQNQRTGEQKENQRTGEQKQNQRTGEQKQNQRTGEQKQNQRTGEQKQNQRTGEQKQNQRTGEQKQNQRTGEQDQRTGEQDQRTGEQDQRTDEQDQRTDEQSRWFPSFRSLIYK
ncbi:hypothetical protein RclHR1_05650002 [Rhizophagus clarus]|nr:hypothetical protein RclHR1_05650002 [Rhizophagus clarus]